MPIQPTQSKRARASGFTLIEILIAVAIVGIIASIAVPSYTAYVTDARRTDGHVALRAAAQSLERCRTETFTYSGCDISGYANSDSGYYDVTLGGESATAYTLTATAVTGRSQSGDTPCVTMTIDQTGAVLPAECW